MTRALTRTNFHSAELVRVLAELSLLDTVEQGAAFAEKLGQWVSFTDAITLSAVHSANAVNSVETPVRVTAEARTELGQAFVRVQAGLMSSIGRVPSELIRPGPDALADAVFAYEPYRRFYLEQQREIDLKLRPLRARAREVLGRLSAQHRQLAALDAALDGILGEREGKLLLKMASLLEMRFKHLAQAHPLERDWLAGFCQEMQRLLLAELDLRMQLVLGLIEACNQDSTTGQHKINE